MHTISIGGILFTIEDKTRDAIELAIDEAENEVASVFPEKSPKDHRKVALNLLSAYISDVIREMG